MAHCSGQGIQTQNQMVADCLAVDISCRRYQMHGASVKYWSGSASVVTWGDAVRRAAGAAQQLPRVWRAYFSQPVLPASLALIMLYFNAVLSPGGLMTAFLSSLGLPGTAAAFFRCASRSSCYTTTCFGPVSTSKPRNARADPVRPAPVCLALTMLTSTAALSHDWPHDSLPFLPWPPWHCDCSL